MNRRNFIYNSAAICFTLAVPTLARPAVKKTKGLKAGIIADLHHDIMHDAPQRLQAFVNEMKESRPDAIMQMGDFAYPNQKNKQVIDLFNNAHSERLHVIGNHDTDSGHTYQQCIDIWGMPSTYYTKQVNGFTFIVLNGNDKGSPAHKGGYASYIGPEQVQWLKQKLADIQGPVIIVSHQPLIGGFGVDNAAEMQQIISSAKDKIVLVLNGHTHIDSLMYADEIPYLTINSASYFWVGGNYKHDSYAKEIHEKYEWISRTCPYRDALFTTVTIHPEKLTIEIKGKPGEWVGKSPAGLGYTQPPFANDKEIVPFIRERKLKAQANVAAQLKNLR
ncbi:MAG: metallophosphoesterase [Chitinophagaceae bacterium]|nr:metallophosphoesterase [Chitinophagaceae bacterium]